MTSGMLWAGLIWFLIFALFPFFNRDALALLRRQKHDNPAFGDYGATVILRHDGFCTLYGHLARRTLDGLREGAAVAAPPRWRSESESPPPRQDVSWWGYWVSESSL